MKHKLKKVLKWTAITVSGFAAIAYSVVAVSVFIAVAGQSNAKSEGSERSQVVSGETAPQDKPDATDIWELSNKQRVEHGVPPLSLNLLLNKSAQAKCDDMVTRNYWSHADPDNRSSWHFIDEVGYSYTNAGENLAEGYAGAVQVVSGWMSSPSHKKTLLDERYVDVGIAVCYSDNYINGEPSYIVVQHFAN